MRYPALCPISPVLAPMSTEAGVTAEASPQGNRHFLIVLNPHGSDETNYELTTMDSYRYVLNPHGSDETSEATPMGEFILTVLNPHGSDETQHIETYVHEADPVLNPHGSDETQTKIV